jgi:hypothetical protein
LNYEQLKDALLKRYNLTEEGFRMKFRDGKPEGGESPEQFIVRLKNNLNRWVELAGVPNTYDALSDLFVKEQFINACPRDLKVHIQERDPKDLSELSDIADKFLLAHSRELATTYPLKNPLHRKPRKRVSSVSNAQSTATKLPRVQKMRKSLSSVLIVSALDVMESDMKLEFVHPEDQLSVVV